MNNNAGIIGGNAVKVRGNLTPPQGAEPTGELHNGQPVYRETFYTPRKVPRRDADGVIMYHLRPDGTRSQPATTLEWDSAERTYILDDLGNGIVTRNFYFRPDAEELSRMAAKAKLAPEVHEARLARLEAALRALGVTEQDLENVEISETQLSAQGARRGK